MLLLLFLLFLQFLIEAFVAIYARAIVFDGRNGFGSWLRIFLIGMYVGQCIQGSVVRSAVLVCLDECL